MKNKIILSALASPGFLSAASLFGVTSGNNLVSPHFSQ